jgi:RNA polymerase sigma factor (sigma-70 family)
MKYENLKNALEKYALENDGSLFDENTYMELLKFAKFIYNKDVHDSTIQFDDDEYIGITNEYLWKALKKYNPDKLNKGNILTFSRIVIANGFRMYLRREYIKNRLIGPNLETIVNIDSEGNEMAIFDLIKDETAYDDFEFEYALQIANEEIDKFLEENSTMIRSIIGRNFKSILEMRVNGMTYEEIGNIYGVNHTTVSRTVYRLLPRIKERLKHKGIL